MSAAEPISSTEEKKSTSHTEVTSISATVQSSQKLHSHINQNNKPVRSAKDQAVRIPPPLFAVVSNGVYRSGYPRERSFSFLKALKLKTCVYLGLHKVIPELKTFIDQEKITLYQIPIEGNKEPFIKIPEDKIIEALRYVLDTKNHPLLVFCEAGAHRTGALMGCVRKLQQWSLTCIFDEYRRFARDQIIRLLDMQFIDLFDLDFEDIWNDRTDLSESEKEETVKKARKFWLKE
ncbi:hypothetical protein RFI_38459 [Reticulomyxa filosa]|uniref:Tyrosine-protein phosphatase domain-containing protein n=1 Tax=Reticulomyxa filosa TaxID=46433 RepID=X6LE61_RETFI|nr:hypothetical protein RFI_38459 [Reticulomyxa filosa]|eukprot:ETN99029.1 hypothetical protein RFI_38459 [Reticulomyxa filosa]